MTEHPPVPESQDTSTMGLHPCVGCGVELDGDDPNDRCEDCTPDTPDVAGVLAEALRAGGLTDKPDEYDSDIHSWRCRYPDIYGPCSCFQELLSDLAAALSPVLAQVQKDEPEVAFEGWHYGVQWPEDSPHWAASGPVEYPHPRYEQASVAFQTHRTLGGTIYRRWVTYYAPKIGEWEEAPARERTATEGGEP